MSKTYKLYDPAKRAAFRLMLAKRIPQDESLHSPVKTLSKGDFTEEEIKEMELSLSRQYGRPITLPRPKKKRKADNDNAERPEALIEHEARQAVKPGEGLHFWHQSYKYSGLPPGKAGKK